MYTLNTEENSHLVNLLSRSQSHLACVGEEWQTVKIINGNRCHWGYLSKEN